MPLGTIVTGSGGEEPPSPQSMAALYSAAVLIGSGSKNVATVWFTKGCPSVPEKVVPLAVIGCSTCVQVFVATSLTGVGTPPVPLSVADALMVSVPGLPLLV